ncbi:MAG TPA: hypothetical protein VIR02_16125 [Anaerolineales bacterium]
MDSSFREQESDRQQAPRSVFVSIRLFVAGVFKWLSGLVRLTEEEREDAGIYLDHPGGE